MKVGVCYSVSRKKGGWGPQKNFEFKDKYLGKFVKTELVGRPYDPDARHYFLNEAGEEIKHDHELGRDEYTEVKCKSAAAGAAAPGGKRKQRKQTGGARRRHTAKKTRRAAKKARKHTRKH